MPIRLRKSPSAIGYTSMKLFTPPTSVSQEQKHKSTSRANVKRGQVSRVNVKHFCLFPLRDSCNASTAAVFHVADMSKAECVGARLMSLRYLAQVMMEETGIK